MNLNILKNINISSIAKSTGNTLNVVKKIIPVYKEVKPYITKEKKLFNNTNQIDEKKESITDENTVNDSLTFFQ